MKKTIISILLVIIAMALYASATIMLSDYQKIFNNFSNLSRLDPQIASKIKFEIRKFPRPAIIVKEAIDKDKIEIYNAEINFDLFSILTLNPKVQSLNIGEVKIFIDHSDVDFVNHSEFISELLDKGATDLRAFIHRLEFTEKTNIEDNIVIKDFIFDGVSEDTKFSGNIEYIGNIKGYFKFDQNLTKGPNDKDSEVQNTEKDLKDEENTESTYSENTDKVLNTLFYLHIENDDLNVEIRELYQKYSTADKTSLRGGKVEIKTNNILRWVSKFAPDTTQFANTKSSTEETNISFIIAPENNWTYFKKINVQSASLQAKGEIAINKNNSGVNKVDLHFSKIDLDNLNKSQRENKNTNEVYVRMNNRGLYNKKIDANVAIDEIKVNDTSTLSNIILQFDTSDDKFSIKKFDGDIGDQGRFTIVGYISHNAFRSIFNGSISLSHTDINEIAEYIGGSQIKTAKKIPFSLLSEIKFSSVDISLQNISIKTNDSELTGSISAKFIGNSPRLNANLTLSNANVDSDNFPALRYITSSIESLFTDSKKDSYLGKFSAIRNINSIGNFNINLNTLTLYEKLYKNISFTLSLLPGELAIRKLYISYDSKDSIQKTNRSKKVEKDFIDFSLDLKALGIKTVADILVHDASLRIANFKAADMLKLKENISRNIALDKFQITTRAYFSKLYNDDFDLGRVVLDVTTQNNLIDINKFDADIFGGRIKTSGSILIDPLTLNLVYGLNSASIDQISNLFLNGYPKTGGVVSASGMWTSNGDSLEKLLYNLYTKSSIVAKDISIDNFSIDDFILKINRPDYKLYNLEDDVRQAVLIGKTTISDMATDIELNEGIIKIGSLKLKTKYSSVVAAALIDIYKFTINMNSKISFLINPTTASISYSEYLSSNIDLTATGDLLSPKKETKFNDLVTIINEREKNTKIRKKR